MAGGRDPGASGPSEAEGVQLKKVELEEDDTLRSFPIVLPKLVDPTVKNAALQAGDWVAQIRPMIADTSGKAGQWWDQVVAITTARYQVWLDAPPLERLRLKAHEMPQGCDRLAQRVTNMLLAAVPASVRSELIGTRQLTPQGIYYKILRVYQPGGLNERSVTLTALTNVQEATGAQLAVEALRLWRRQLDRTTELGATLPDATLLIGALDNLMRKVLRDESQAGFRVNTYRMLHAIDTRPTLQGVQQYYEVLLAEAEMLANSQPLEAPVGEAPAIKALEKPGTSFKPDGGASTAICRWYGTDVGCRHGKSCRMLHPQFEDKTLRCWACGSPQHKKATCPHAKKEDGESTGGSRGSEGIGEGRGTKGKSLGKGKKGKKGDATGHELGSQRGGESTTSSTPSGAPSTVDKNQVDAKREGPTAKKAEVPSQPEAGAGEASELMGEVTNLLRSLRVGTPQIRTCKIRRLEASESRNMLIDGGATHCLRQTTSCQEWQGATPVTVYVATGEVQMRASRDSDYPLGGPSARHHPRGAAGSAGLFHGVG